MSKIRSVKNSFTSGELDPALHERYDFQPHTNGVKTLESFLIKPQGGITRRWGSRFVASAKNKTATRLISFVFSVTQSNILEFGNFYIRVFGNNGQIIDGGSPVEIVSPYSTADIPDLYITQNADTLIIAHPNHQTRILARLSSTEWQLRLFIPTPPPTKETGFDPATTFVLASTSGFDIFAAAVIPAFTDADVDRMITEKPSLGNGVAIIRSFIDATNIKVDVISPFSKLTYPSGEWHLHGSPVAQLTVEKSKPIGALTSLTLQKLQENAATLIVNGDFSFGSTGWTDLSGPIISSGTDDGAGTRDQLLQDSLATFQTDGVQIGYRAINVSDGTEEFVVSVNSEVEVQTTPGGNDWTNGESYEIRPTGSIIFSGGTATLNGGGNGAAHLEQAIITTANVTYRLTFSVASQPLAVQIGSTSGDDDIFSESSFDVNNENELTFTATSAATFIQFRNNQNVNAVLDDVAVRQFDVNGFRTFDVGKFVRVNEGIIEIIQFIDATRVTGIIRKELIDDLAALPGAWSLEMSSWSAQLGWPETCTILNNRLHFFASATYPQTVWGSRAGFFQEFGTGTEDGDALEFQISATQINRGEWIAGERVLLAGTQREEFSMRGSVGNSLTPTSIEVISPTSLGSNGVQPIRTDRTILFVQRGGRRLREIVFSITADERVANDLSILAEHLLVTGIRTIAYQQEPIPLIWVVTNDNKLLSLTYLLDHQVIGWAQHPMDGEVKWVAVIPHPDGDRDQVWVMVDRGNGGVPHLEYLDDQEGFYGPLMMDSTLTQTFDPPTTTVSNLHHLNGKEVAILGDGSAQPNKTVVGGTITLSTAASNVEVGLPFTPKVVTLRPAINGIPFAGLKLSTPRVFVSFLDTLNAIVNEERVTFSLGDGLMDNPPDLFTGLKEVSTVGWDFENEITIEQDLPYPIHIRGIFYTLITEDI